MFKAITQATAVMGLALGATFIAPAERVEARNFGSSDCGGLNQKTCISLNRNKRCDSGLVEKKQSGRNICVEPSTPGDKTGGCGALNQVTCITLIKSKRCDAGLIEVTQRGRNICIKDEIGADTTPDCGGLDQKSCWSGRISQWCDAGLIYKPGALPGKGVCRAPEEGDMIQATRAAISRFNALPKDNEFASLRKCLVSPSRFGRLKRAMKASNTNGTNAIIRECDVDVSKMQDIAAYILDRPSTSASRNVTSRNAASTQDWDDNLNSKMRLTLELSVDASFFKSSAAAAIGYAIPLHDKPLGSRWYKNSDDFLGGVDVAVGGDLMIGIGFPGVPGGDNAVEGGYSGVIAGALGVKLAGTLRGDDDNAAMMFGVMGGAGLGATVAMYEYRNEFFEDK